MRNLNGNLISQFIRSFLISSCDQLDRRSDGVMSIFSSLNQTDRFHVVVKQTELRKAHRTVGVNCYTFFPIFLRARPNTKKIL